MTTAQMATSAFFGPGGQHHDWRQYGDALPAAGHHAQHNPSGQSGPHFPNRLAALSNASTSTTPGMAVMTSGDHSPSILGSSDPATAEDNRRTLDFIAQLLNPSTRETALLELSKKREQVPELALVLWHSFGKLRLFLLDVMASSSLTDRCDDGPAPGDHLCLPALESIPVDRCIL